MEKKEVGWACGMHGEGEIHTWIRWGNLKHRKRLGDLSALNGWLLLKCILKKQDGKLWKNPVRNVQVTDSSEHCNATSVSVKYV